MTTVIDERVVEMRFNNADFEKNVAQSMSTLDTLKKSLNFDSAKSLDDLGKASKNFSLAGITETITEATSKFSVLEIAGITAIAKITSAAMDMGVALAKSLSVDQVSMGFDKYAQKTQAVQTIIAATGESIGYVTEQIGKLNWFTDETSYNLTDMTNNIAKFTSNGIALENAVTQMMGIANAAALSGAGVESASHAMEGFSKAIAKGKMDRQNWKWISTAKMDTMQFKQSLIDAAVEVGTLTKAADGYFKTLSGHEVTLTNFEENMKDGWMTARVMSEALETYGSFSVKLNDTFETLKKTQSNLTTSDLLDYIDEYKKGTLDIAETADYLNISTEQLEGMMQELTDDAMALGNKAFKAGQEAKTFKEAIDAVKDAVSTGWMNTFELIFGNYEQAKKLWTGLANTMWDVFASGGERRNETLKLWKERNSLIEAFVNLLNVVLGPLNAVREAWYSMFADQAGDRAKTLDRLTVAFKKFTETLLPSEKVIANIYTTFKGLFTAGKVVVSVFTSIVKALVPVARPFGSLLEMFTTFTAYIGAFIIVVSEYIEKMGVFQTITEVIASVFGKLVEVAKVLAGVFVGAVYVGVQKFITVITKLVNATANFIRNSKTIQSVLSKIRSGFDSLKRIISGTEKPIEKVTTVVQKAERCFSEAAESGVLFGTVTKGVGDESTKAITPLQKFLNIVKLVGVGIAAVAITIGKGIVNVFKNFTKFFDGIKQRFVNANKDSKTFFDYIKSVFVVIGELLGEAGNKIKEFFDKLGIDTSGVKKAFDTIGNALTNLIKVITPGKILAIGLSVALLALVGAAIDVASKFRDMASAVTGVFTSINKILKRQFSKTSVITDFAKAFGILAASLALLTFVDQDKLKSVSGIMLGFTVIFSGIAIAIGALSKRMEEVKGFRKNFSGISRSILELAASMTVLVLSVAILAGIKIDNANEMWWKVEMAVVLLASVAAAAIALSKYVVSLPKGSILLLALAFSMRQLVKALVEFSTLPYDDIDKHWSAFLAMFAGLSAVIAASARIGLGSAVGIFVASKLLGSLVAPMKEIISAINELPLVDMLKIALDKLERMQVFIIALASTIAILKMYSLKMKGVSSGPKIGGIFKGLGGTIAAFGMSFALIVLSLKSLKTILDEMTPGQAADVFMTAIGIVLTITSFFGAIMLLDKFDVKGSLDKNFKSMGAAMIGLGAAFILIAKAVDIIAKTNMDGLVAANATIIGIGALLGIVLYAAGNVTKAIPAVAAMIGAVTAIGVLIGELAVLSIMLDSTGDIAAALGILGSIMVGLSFVMSVMSGLKDVKTGPILSLAIALGLVGASLAILANQDLTGVLVAAMAMSGVMVVLVGIMDKLKLLSNVALNLATILGLIGLIGILGYSLNTLAKNPWEQIRTAGIMLSLVLVSIAGALAVLGRIDPVGTVIAAGAIGVVSLAMIALAHTLTVLQGVDWSTFGKMALAILELAGTVGALGGLAIAFPPFLAAIGVGAAIMIGSAIAFAAVAASFALFGSALPILAEGINAIVPALNNLLSINFLKLAGELLAFAGTGSVIGLLSPLLIVAAAGIAAFSLAIGLLSVILQNVGTGFEVLSDGLGLVGNTIGRVVTGIKQKIEDIKTSVSGLFKDMQASFMGATAGGVIKAAQELGSKIAGSKSTNTGLIGSMAAALGWHSPPEFITSLMTDIGTALGLNAGAVSAAESSGSQIGNGLGKSIFSSAMPWIDNIGAKLSNLFGGLKSTSSNLGDRGYPTAQTKAYGDAIDSASNSLGFFAGIQNVFNSASDKAKDILGLNADATDYVSDAVEDLTGNMENATGATEGFGDALEGAGGKAGKAGKDLKDFGSTLKDTIENQLDIFTKFELKQGITAETMLQNMKSNIDGFASWSHRLAVLAERGIDQALYQKLAEMGPKGYETVSAFVQMTDEQLQEANQLFAQSLTLPQSQSDIVTAGFKYAGEMAAQGFSNALDDHKAAHDAAQGLGQAAIDGIDEKLQIHSPSKVMWQRGWFSQLGFREGLRAGQPITITTITQLCSEILETFTTELDPEKFSEAANTFVSGLFANMLTENQEEESNPIVMALVNGLLTFEILDEALTTFSEHVKTMFYTLFEIGGDSAPSMWAYRFIQLSVLGAMANSFIDNAITVISQIALFCVNMKGMFIRHNFYHFAYDIGKNIALGLKQGIEDYAEEAIQAAREMAEAVISILATIPDINSPSKVTKKLGGYISQGYAIGIRDGAYNVYQAAKGVAESAIDGMSSVGRLQDVLNEEFDFNPVITPILDLSYVKEQLEELNYLMAIPVSVAPVQNEGNSTKDNKPSQINFTQNNYSPKSLSRYEIYRQTKNQISQLKGVMG